MSHSRQVIRAYVLLEKTAGREFDPMSNGDVARAIGECPPVAFRALSAAAEAGWMEQMPDGRWRHSVSASQIFYGVQQLQPRSGVPVSLLTGHQKHLTNKIRNAYRVIEILAGRELNPIKTSDVANTAGIRTTEATLILQAAESAGWAKKADDGGWKTGDALVRIAVAASHGYQRARSRLEDQIHNRTRSAW